MNPSPLSQLSTPVGAVPFPSVSITLKISSSPLPPFSFDSILNQDFSFPLDFLTASSPPTIHSRLSMSSPNTDSMLSSFSEEIFQKSDDLPPESPMKSSSENKESKKETSVMESKPPESSTGSSSEMNNLSNSIEIIKETVKDSSNSILKSAPVANTYKMGKSVRTKRPYDEIQSGSKLETNATNIM
ncbi:hypothetical protein L2E82_51349 [Cichorium intybus]|nr:hypothetical protein L2E82_51349 [Cichorium intybus]